MEKFITFNNAEYEIKEIQFVFDKTSERLVYINNRYISVPNSLADIQLLLSLAILTDVKSGTFYVNPEAVVSLTDTSSNVQVKLNTGKMVVVSEDLETVASRLNLADRVDKDGLMDYNDTTGAISLIADVWTDIPNNGLGAFTNKTHKPTSVNEVLDTSTGYLDFSELTLGSQILVRNDFTVVPSTNNCLLEARYLLGQGAGEYALKFWSERLDSGSGIDYQRVISFPIYMGDTNTQGGAGKLQVKLSTNGTVTNAGSYINIQLR